MTEEEKSEAARLLGKLGGAKGRRTRAKNMTKEERSEAARKAAKARWAKKRTLTNLYNQRPTWLENAHARLDEAVFAAYGWPSHLSDEEVLQNLLALNIERSKPA
jgi:hypothetical protein